MIVSDVMNEVALELRFRGHDMGRGVPDVDAFRRAPSPTPERAEALAVLRGSRPLHRSAPLVVFFQHTGYGIPPLGEPDDRPLDLSSWCVQATVFGWLASVPPERPRSTPSRAAWVIAACLPLVIPSVADAAAGPAEIQRPRKGKPKSKPVLPDEAEADAEPDAEADADVEADPDADADADAEVDPDAEAGEDPPPDAWSPDTLTPPSHEEPPPRPRGVNALDPATVDAAWEGVDGYDVELELKGGAELRGRIGAVQRDTFTLIQASTGQVLVLPKSGVLSLRVYVPPPIPSKRGTGLLVGGSILTSIGAPVFISGVVMLGIYPSGVFIHLPLLFIGGGMLAGGIPMLVSGSRRRQAYNEALEKHQLAPVVIRTRHGWTGGLRFRF
jgi:hypothetical protein